MLKSYLKIAWRNITRHKKHTAINVIGLALGMSCCLFIFLWVQDERNIDDFQAQGNSLYAAYQTVTANGKVSGGYSTPTRYEDGHNNFPLEDLPAAVPEVEQLAFYAKGYELPWGHPESFQVGQKIARMKGSRATGNFFTLLSFPLVEGRPATALKDIASIAISRKMAEIFFGGPAKAMGKTIR